MNNSPIPVRYAVEFTLKVNNCLGCHFCPQDKLAAAYVSDKHTLSMDDFKEMLSKVPKHVEISFSGFSETFLHPLAGEMIEYASERGYPIHLFTTLMGLNQRHVEHLKRSHFAYIRLHVPDKKGLKIPTPIWLRQLDLFQTAGHSFTSMTMGELEQDMFEAMTQRNIHVEYPQMLSRAGNLWTPETRPITGPVTCYMQRWHMNVVLPNGDMVLCSMDYALKMPVGNLLTQNFTDIVAASDKYEANYNPSGDHPCRFCDWAMPA